MEGGQGRNPFNPAILFALWMLRDRAALIQLAKRLPRHMPHWRAFKARLVDDYVAFCAERGEAPR